jgi:hypothetical protein
MAEPYVPIAQYSPVNVQLISLEVITNASTSNATALSTATSSALTSKNTAESALAEKFDLMFLVGG